MTKTKTTFQRKTHTIDATDKILGRLATEVATKLTGKDRIDYEPRIDKGGFVIVENVGQVKFSGTKLEQKVFYRHSGYPGGIKTTKLSELFGHDAAAVLKQAVFNMLPKNKLRPDRMKRLSFK